MQKTLETDLSNSKVVTRLSEDLPIGAGLPTLRIMHKTPKLKTSGGKLLKEFTGHVTFWHRARQFYERPFVGDDKAPSPDCASSDGIKPDEGKNRQSELCETCPKNQYGSDIQGGPYKGCRRQIRLYVLMDNDPMPCIIKVGPFRLNRRDGLLQWLTNATNQGGDNGYRIFKSRFALHTQIYDQVSVSILDIETVRVLNRGIEADVLLLATLNKLYKSFHRKYQHRIDQNTPDSEYWQKKTDRLWRTLITRAGCCAYCGTTMHLEAHHLISRINSLTRHKVECGLCLCRYHHLYSSTISPHRHPKEFTKWLKKNMPEKYWWLQKNRHLRTCTKIDFKDAYEELALSYSLF